MAWKSLALLTTFKKSYILWSNKRCLLFIIFTYYESFISCRFFFHFLYTFNLKNFLGPWEVNHVKLLFVRKLFHVFWTMWHSVRFADKSGSDNHTLCHVNIQLPQGTIKSNITQGWKLSIVKKNANYIFIIKFCKWSHKYGPDEAQWKHSE